MNIEQSSLTAPSHWNNGSLFFILAYAVVGLFSKFLYWTGWHIAFNSVLMMTLIISRQTCDAGFVVTQMTSYVKCRLPWSGSGGAIWFPVWPLVEDPLSKLYHHIISLCWPNYTVLFVYDFHFFPQSGLHQIELSSFIVTFLCSKTSP